MSDSGNRDGDPFGELDALRRRVAELEEAERALKASEARWRSVTEHPPDLARNYLDIAGVIIVALDANANVTLINKKGCEVLGGTEEEILGVNWIDTFIHERERDGVRAVFAELMAGRLDSGEYHENAIITMNGEERTLAWRNTILRDAAGRITGTLSSGEDITQRKRAEEALRESEELLRATLESTEDGVLVVEGREQVTHFNKRFVDLWHIPEDIVETRQDPKLLDYVLDQLMEPQAFLEKVRRLYDSAEEDFDTLRFKDGRVYERFSHPLIREGRIAGRVWSFRDVTARKRAEEERRQMDAQIRHIQKLESLGVMAGGIAHDFNNLLTAILGQAYLASEDLPAESPARESIELIQETTQRAAQLTAQLLAYSGKGRFVVRPLNLSKLIEEMAHLLRASISKNATLTYHLAEDLPAVEADASQLQQVVMNLIINASDAIGQTRGVITVATGLSEVDQAEIARNHIAAEPVAGTYVYLEVADTGCGMDEPTRARIFDPFFTTKRTGRGLGLAALLGIVRGHRGAIKVDSEPGQGATFRVLLPLTERPAEGSADASEGRERWRGSGTILVVDDEPPVLTVARMILERAGFTVIAAEDGRRAVEVFREHADRIVAVLLDVTMPEASGEEAFWAMRRIQSDVPILLASGYTEEDVSGRLAVDGAAAFIHKPYHPSWLIGKLREMIEG